ncbi:MAG TPA: DUF4097 family beta strand repeat-containing protein [Steroidobacteraceae bacterium]|jgi:DUF4097 and DUF4098 domain-containing protein YvlB
MRAISSMAAAALLLATGVAQADDVERSAPADPHGQVEIVTVSGEIHILGWDRPEVQVKASIGDHEELRLDSSDRHTSIRVVRANGGQTQAATDLTVHVPRGSALNVSTISADQTIEDIRGSQRLQAVSGSITTRVWSEELQVKTISGDIEIHGNKTPSEVSVQTTSGDIVLSGTSGDLTLETVTGDMDINTEQLGRGRIHTTNGDLRLRTKLANDARVDAEAINGDLRFTLRKPVDAEFDVETFNGAIDNCFGPKATRTREFAPGNALRFKEGAGGARVRVKTLNGGVEICRE